MPHEVWQQQIGITFSKVNFKGLEFSFPDSYPSVDDLFSEDIVDKTVVDQPS